MALSSLQTFFLSFLYCTGVPTRFELCGGGERVWVPLVFCSCCFLCLLLLLIILLIGAYAGTTFDCGSLSLSQPPWEVSARSSFLRVSEGVALYLFVFFKEPVYFLHFKKNQNVPEFQIPHAKMSPEIRENKQTKDRLWKS